MQNVNEEMVVTLSMVVAIKSISERVWKVEKTGIADEFDTEWREREESKMTLRF